MNIALVAESVDSQRGGAETSTGQFVHQLLAQGQRVDLYTRSEVEEVRLNR